MADGHINRGNKNALWVSFGAKRYYLRSKYELKYAYYAEYLKRNGQIKDWYYESDEFWFHNIKRGVRSYKPDFKLVYNDDSVVFIEAKGYWDAKSLTKIKRFKKYYPELAILTVDTGFFSKHNTFLNHLLKTMEGIAI